MWIGRNYMKQEDHVLRIVDSLREAVHDPLFDMVTLQCEA